MKKSVDAVILTYRPGREFFEIVKKLEAQSVRPDNIIVMNTGKEYFDRLPDAVKYLDSFGNVQLYHVLKNEFNHGKTRNEAASHSSADYLIFMTMDAVPENDRLIEELLLPMENEDVAISYARQLPKEGCGAAERYNRAFNYPDTDVIKGKEDIGRLGVKTYFCSNVCACYKRKIFDELGGFTDDTIFNEDMIYAAGAVKQGYKIFYASKARVYHSHDYSAKMQYHRNFDLGVSQAEHPEVFKDISSESEGIKLVKGSISYLAREGRIFELPDFIIKCAARYLGYRRGIRYERLSKKEILKMTTNREYFLNRWEKEEKA